MNSLFVHELLSHFESLVSGELQHFLPFSGQQSLWGGLSCLFILNLPVFHCVFSFLSCLLPRLCLPGSKEPRDSVLGPTSTQSLLWERSQGVGNSHGTPDI